MDEEPHQKRHDDVVLVAGEVIGIHGDASDRKRACSERSKHQNAENHERNGNFSLFSGDAFMVGRLDKWKKHRKLTVQNLIEMFVLYTGRDRGDQMENM